MSPANSPDMRRAHNPTGRGRGPASRDSVAEGFIRSWSPEQRARVREFATGPLGGGDWAEFVALIDQVSKEEQEED